MGLGKRVATGLLVVGAAVAAGTVASASTTVSVVATIPGGGSGITASGGYVYVAENVGSYPTNGLVRVIDQATNAEVASVTVGNTPQGVAVSGDYLYVAINNSANNTAQAGSVEVIDIHDPTAPLVFTTIQDVSIYSPGAVVAANGYVYVGDCSGGSPVAVIRASDNTVVGSVPLTNQCSAGMSAAGNFLYAKDGDQVAVIDADPASQTFLTILRTIPLTTPAGGVTPIVSTLVASGSSIYVGDSANALFQVIDTSTELVVATISDPITYPTAMAAGAGYVYVSYDSPGAVLVIDTHTNTVLGIVDSIGDYQDNIAADGQNAYSSGADQLSVSVIYVGNSGSEMYVPMQAYGIAADGTCAKNAPNHVNWPGIASQESAGWASSWQQWPNNGTGGYVCFRQPYYTGSGYSIR